MAPIRTIRTALRRRYHQWFSIGEIEQSLVLQYALAALLLTFLVTFYGWIKSPALSVQSYTANTFLCWPHFEQCGIFHVFNRLPYGYSQSMLYMGLFALITYTAYAIWKQQWTRAHAAIVVLWLFKVFVLFVATMALVSNFDYYDIVFGLIILFLPYKETFLKIAFALLYFLAATIKIDNGWILGTYFTSLITGLPIYGNAIAPLVTNIVIGMQIVGAWFLLSENKILQRSAFVYFFLFHLYSGIIVGLRYLITTVPMLIILFGPNYRPPALPLTRRSIIAWAFIIALGACQLIPLMMGQDKKLTLEDDYYGLYMFEANHQCVSNAIIYTNDGRAATSTKQNILARNRCNPYMAWFHLKQLCERNPSIARIAWTFDHSINGGPFYRIVDVENACALTYSPVAHNPWIKRLADDPIIVGYPVKNIYYNTL